MRLFSKVVAFFICIAQVRIYALSHTAKNLINVPTAAGTENDCIKQVQGITANMDETLKVRRKIVYIKYSNAFYKLQSD